MVYLKPVKGDGETSALKDLDALNSLETDPLLAQLDVHVPSLSIFDLLGCTRDEIAHSRAIAILFDSCRHRQADVMLRTFTERIISELNAIHAECCVRFQQAVSPRWTRVQVHRELFKIDIVIEIHSVAGVAVIGIENKIDAVEQRKQIARYQASLSHAFPHYTPVIVFLAPSKRRSETADASSNIPCVVLDYSALVDAIRKALEQTEPDSTDARALREIVRHFEEDLLKDKQLRKLVHKLWRSHPRALQLAIEHRPRMENIRQTYEELLRAQFSADAAFKYYPNRGEVREIKMSLNSWKQVGLPFTFMFYADSVGCPCVRLFIWWESYDKYARSLRKWAHQVNAVAGTLIDKDFRLVKHWPEWHRVFHEEDYPAAAELDKRGFDDDTAREAAHRVLYMIETLRPHVKRVA